MAAGGLELLTKGQGTYLLLMLQLNLARVAQTSSRMDVGFVLKKQIPKEWEKLRLERGGASARDLVLSFDRSLHEISRSFCRYG